jgi:hypothetical protein
MVTPFPAEVWDLVVSKTEMDVLGNLILAHNVFGGIIANRMRFASDKFGLTSRETHGNRHDHTAIVNDACAVLACIKINPQDWSECLFKHGFLAMLLREAARQGRKELVNYLIYQIRLIQTKTTGKQNLGFTSVIKPNPAHYQILGMISGLESKARSETDVPANFWDSVCDTLVKVVYGDRVFSEQGDVFVEYVYVALEHGHFYIAEQFLNPSIYRLKHFIFSMNAGPKPDRLQWLTWMSTAIRRFAWTRKYHNYETAKDLIEVVDYCLEKFSAIPCDNAVFMDTMTGTRVRLDDWSIFSRVLDTIKSADLDPEVFNYFINKFDAMFGPDPETGGPQDLPSRRVTP